MAFLRWVTSTGGFANVCPSIGVVPFSLGRSPCSLRLRAKCLYSSVVERQSCKLKVLGSIPSGGSIAFRLLFQVCRSALKGVNPTCCSGGLPASGPSPVSRHYVRVAKEMDSKSIGLCPQGFESPRCRFAAAVRVRHPFISCSQGPSLPGWCPSKLLAQSVVVDGKAYSRRDSNPQSPP